MTLVQLASLGAGIAQWNNGTVAPGRAGTIYLHGTSTPVTLYTDETGGTILSSIGVFTTDSAGRVPGWVTLGLYVDITIPPAATIACVLGGVAVSSGDAALPSIFLKPSGDTTGSTDTTRITNALSALSTYGGEVVLLPSATQHVVGGGSPITIPTGCRLRLAAGTNLGTKHSGGSDVFLLAEAASLIGDGPENSSQIHVLNGANIARLVATVTASSSSSLQESAFLVGLKLYADAGSTIGDVMVDFRQVFTNTFIRDLVALGNYIAPGIMRVGGGAATGGGALIDLYNLNLAKAASGDVLLITENNPTKGDCKVWGHKITAQYPALGGGGTCINIKGYGSLRVSLRDLHCEIPSPPSAAQDIIRIDGAQMTILDGVGLLADAGITNLTGIHITSNALNILPRIESVKNSSGISPVLQDDLNGVTLGSGDVPAYYGKSWQTYGTPTRSYYVSASNATWPVPFGATLLRVSCVGGGGGGGGGGSASSAIAQAGGAGGGAGLFSEQVVAVGANTTLNVTIGTGGAAGGGGAASGFTGTSGIHGSDTTVTGTGISVVGKGGGHGPPSPANSSANVSPLVYGGEQTGAATTAVTAGMGGSSGSSGGNIGGGAFGLGGGGGSGGGASSTTLGGVGGNAGTATAGGAAVGAGGAGTTAGGVGANAGANTGAGAGGGGGGAWNGGAGPGAGGNGGVGGSGFVIIEVIG